MYSQSADIRISKLRFQRWDFSGIKNLQRLAKCWQMALNTPPESLLENLGMLCAPMQFPVFYQHQACPCPLVAGEAAGVSPHPAFVQRQVPTAPRDESMASALATFPNAETLAEPDPIPPRDPHHCPSAIPAPRLAFQSH